jgi:multiple antibiotic resistance protein
MTLFSLVLSLVLILDPLGNIPIFAAVLKSYSPKDQIKIIIRELLIALILLVGFQFFGALLLEWMQISIPAVKVAGGLILFLIALGMIFPIIKTTGVPLEDGGEPFIVPLSVPLVAGPSILAVIIAYSVQVKSSFTMLLAILIAWAVTFSILIFTPLLKKMMNEKALIACERLMGLLLTFIGTEMFLSGVIAYCH